MTLPTTYPDLHSALEGLGIPSSTLDEHTPGIVQGGRFHPDLTCVPSEPLTGEVTLATPEEFTFCSCAASPSSLWSGAVWGLPLLTARVLTKTPLPLSPLELFLHWEALSSHTRTLLTDIPRSEGPWQSAYVSALASLAPLLSESLSLLSAQYSFFLSSLGLPTEPPSTLLLAADLSEELFDASSTPPALRALLALSRLPTPRSAPHLLLATPSLAPLLSTEHVPLPDSLPEGFWDILFTLSSTMALPEAVDAALRL